MTVPDHTQAQTTTELVSNSEQSRPPAQHFVGTNDIETGLAQAFTTGPSAAGYNLDDVGIDINAKTGIQPGTALTVHIYTVSSNRPGTQVHTLTSPSTLDFRLNTFTAPSGAILAGETRYMLAFAGTADNKNDIGLAITDSDSEDTSSLPGWKIEDAMRQDGSLFRSASLRFEVRGSIINTEPTGLPTIAQEGLTFVADVAAIADADGVENATYEYQWIDVDGMTDTDITNATDRTYTVTAADAGKTIKVKVTFTDDAGSREELTSATKTVQVPPETPTNLTAQHVAPMRIYLDWEGSIPSLKDLDHENPPGYRIEWSADGNAPWTSLVNVRNHHGEFEIWCACYGTHFNDNTIAPGTTRHYRIQAVDKQGSMSNYSDVVSATTPGLVDSDQGEIKFGVVASDLDALNDQKVFQIYMEDAGASFRFTIRGKASKHRVSVTEQNGTEIWNDVLGSNNNLVPRFTTQRTGIHRVKISHGGTFVNAASLTAGWFQFALVPEREETESDLALGADEILDRLVLNTYGDDDRIELFVEPGKAYAVRVRGRSGDDTTYGTAATPRIKRARPPSTTHVYNMGKPWVDGVTIAKRSPICPSRLFAEPEKCEYQAFVIDLRGQTGAQQTWPIDVAPTARPGTRPYHIGTYAVDLRELSSSELQGVRMPLRAWFASPPAQHDGSNAIKVRVAFNDAVDESPENVGAHGVKVEGGQVTSVRPVGGDAPDGAGTRSAGGRNAGEQDREVVWEFEIEPDSDGEVTVSLEAWRPCDETGAICTADGRVLSQGISTTVRGPGGAPPPLTASFESMPEAHDGESAFRFRVAFSENIGISYRSLREDAFEVSGGRVTRGARVDDRRDLFEMTVEPDGDGEVTVTLPAGRECTVSGAICTKGENRRQLTNAPAATVAGPAVETGPAGLTARFVDMPSEHDGKTAFKLRIAFSEEIRMSGRRLRSDVVAVAGGRATKAGRVKGRKDLWKLTVEPDSLADVTVTLSSGAACDAPEAVCTKDGRALSNTVSATVKGPVAVSVADARAEEGTDETIDFAVSLSRAASGPVTVDYTTADGSATAGSDYARTSGTLTFNPGATAKTISVPVLDDAHDEGEETMRLRLSAATGAMIADGVATGTIENNDHMPRAWMVRFGRTIGSQVVDALTARLEGGASSHVTVGGINLTGAPGVEPEGEAEDPFGLPEWAKQTRREEDAQTLNADDLLLRSAFHLSSGGGTQGPAFTAWGRVATGGFEATVDDVTMDGDVTTGLIGFDAEWDRLLAGVMLSQSEGDGAYRLDPAKGDDAGTVESTLTGVYPYARVDLNARVSAWALAGMGSGEITLHQEGAKPMPTDIRLRMGALGVKGEVLDGTGPGGLAVNVKSDAMWVGTKSADTSELAPTEGDVTRVRFIVEGERAFEVGEGATFTPSAEVGLRHDGGDAETGTGLEVGGGVRYTAGQLTIEGQVRTLMAHEDGGYKEWGASGAIRITPSPSGHGLMLAIAPEWGRTASATERLWSARDASALGADGEFEADRRLAIDAGYGIGLRHGRGVLTPYAGLTLGDAGARTVRTGARWRLGPDAVLGLETTRQASRAGEADNQLMLRAALRF